MKLLILLFINFLVLTNIFSQTNNSKYEFRGAWVATVANIDWPVSSATSSSGKIKELENLFDRLEEAGINAVFFQVRPACDAFYKSEIEPWSYWLTGVQGNAPDNNFDPLATAIEMAHERNIEIHAWINPLRAGRDDDKYKLAASHPVNRYPDWILKIGGYRMLDPGIPEVRSYVANIVKDIVSRYDIDGVHFDDYFYPYGPVITNEDRHTFRKYGNSSDDLAGWRRENIDKLIEEVNNSIKKTKSYIKFGISPFGIVKNEFAKTKGFESYYSSYSDPLEWIKRKSLDYIVPQLYWEIGFSKADYVSLLEWWGGIDNPFHFYSGLYSSKYTAEDYKKAKSEIYRQIMLNRKNDKAQGSVLFSAKTIVHNYSGLRDSLKNNYFRYPAFTPIMNWKDNIPPEAPVNASADFREGKIKLLWDHPAKARDLDLPYRYVVYGFKKNEVVNTSDPSRILTIVNGKFSSVELSVNRKDFGRFVITSLDRLNNESTDFIEIECE